MLIGLIAIRIEATHKYFFWTPINPNSFRIDPRTNPNNNIWTKQTAPGVSQIIEMDFMKRVWKTG
tara:strand:+ start:223 stop:417 length:195 start_codon:yes stop_codon:yes gene_type:complete